MADTLGTLKAEIADWLDEILPDSRMNSAVNDAIESLWETLMRASLSLFMGGPVGLTISAGTEGVALVSVVDPTTAPTVTDAVEGALAAHTIYAAYTLVTESGSETLPSSVATHSVAQDNVASVAAPTFVSGAIGWNCYMADATGRLAKQNDTPISFGVDYQEPATGVVDDPDLPGVPTENTTGDDICYIRHLEAQMPDLGYKKYEGADLGSMLMQRAAASIACDADYQNYYWDLINQRQLEFRPAIATTFTPRYFYVKRPRRLRFDNAPLPFMTMPSIAFLRCFALSRLSISVREFESARAWKAEAEEERTRCELAVLQMNSHKNTYVTPFPG